MLPPAWQLRLSFKLGFAAGKHLNLVYFHLERGIRSFVRPNNFLCGICNGELNRGRCEKFLKHLLCTSASMTNTPSPCLLRTSTSITGFTSSVAQPTTAKTIPSPQSTHVYAHLSRGRKSTALSSLDISWRTDAYGGTGERMGERTYVLKS